VIIDNAQDKDSDGYVEDFNGDGYISSGIIYGVSAVFNWMAPSVMVLLGLKVSGSHQSS